MYANLTSLGDLIRAWIAVLRLNRRGFIELAVAALGLSLLAFGFSVFTGLTAKESGIAIAIAAILIIPYLAASLVLNLAALEMTQAGLGGKSMPLREALGNGLHKLMSSIGIAIMQFIITMASVVPFAIVYFLMSSLLDNTTIIQAIGRPGLALISGLGLLGVIGMITVVILVGIKIRFAVAALVADGTRSSQAIRSSWNMTSGRLWSVTWRMIVFSIVVGIPLSIVSLVLLRLGGISAVMEQNDLKLSLGQSLWSSVIDGLTIAVLMLSQAGFMMAMWQDLKRTKA